MDPSLLEEVALAIRQINAEPSAEARFISTQTQITGLDKGELPRLLERRRENPVDYDNLYRLAASQFLVACLAIERNRAVRELIDDLHFSQAEVARLAGYTVKTDPKTGEPVLDEDTGEAVMVPNLTRQRVNQLYSNA